MTVIGTNNDSKTGAFPEPEADRAAAAAVVVSKMALGLVADSLLQVLIGTNEMMRSSHFHIESSRPTLTPLSYTRVGTETTQEGNEPQKALYKEFASLLPLTMQQELAKPASERDSRYTALENVLRLAANVTVWASNLQSMDEVKGSAADSLKLYQLVPYVELKGAMEVASDLSQTIGSVLNDVGNNLPESSSWQDRLQGFNELLSSGQELIGRIFSGQAAPGDVEGLHSLASQMSLFLSSNSPEGGGIVLDAQVKAFLGVIESFRSPTESSPTLLLGLFAASAGLGGGGASDPLGGLSTLVSTLSGGAGTASDPGAGALMLSAVALTAIGIALCAQSILGGSLGPSSGDGDVEAKSGRVLECSLILAGLLQFGALQSAIDHLGNASGVPEGGKELYSSQMTLGVLLFSAAAVGGSDTGVQASLLSGVEKSFGELLSTVAKGWSEQAAESGDTEMGKSAAILEQASSLAHDGDLSGALDTVWGVLEHLGVSQSDFFQGVVDLNTLSQNLLLSLSSSRADAQRGGTEVFLTA